MVKPCSATKQWGFYHLMLKNFTIKIKTICWKDRPATAVGCLCVRTVTKETGKALTLRDLRQETIWGQPNSIASGWNGREQCHIKILKLWITDPIFFGMTIDYMYFGEFGSKNLSDFSSDPAVNSSVQVEFWSSLSVNLGLMTFDDPLNCWYQGLPSVSCLGWPPQDLKPFVSELTVGPLVKTLWLLACLV